MIKTIVHPVWGKVTYEESIWSGAKYLYINGQPLMKLDRNTFLVNKEEKIYAYVKGSYLSGVTVVIKGEAMEIIPKAKWYEWISCVLIFVLNLVWGNSRALCSIVPIVGGAVGGAISGLAMVLYMYFVRKTRKWWKKLLIWLGVMAGTFLVCFVVASLILAAAKK